MGNIAPNSINVSLQPKLPYDPVADFAPVSLVAATPNILVVHPSLPVKTVKDLVALARARPGQLNFSSAGVGSGTHFAAELFKSMAGVDVVHVPFKGIPEALTETVTGRVQFFMAPIANAVNLTKDGRLLALGVSSVQRDALVPDVPTIAEAGVPGYDSILWFGLLTSSKVPRPVIAKLNREIARYLRDPDAKTRWAPIGLDPRPTTPEAFDKLIADDMATFTRLARAGNIKAD
jgi:tripartite-type tricarboxylate transporter receptor subunit TctC